jgi:hypothetical protein
MHGQECQSIIQIFFFLKKGIIWHTAETLRPQCLHLLSESRWSHSSQQDLLLMFVDTFPFKCRQITPLNDTESIKQQEAIKEHRPESLVIQSTAIVQAAKYRPYLSTEIQKVYIFYYPLFCCASFLFFWIASEIIGCDLRSDCFYASIWKTEEKKLKLLFEHLKGKFIHTALVSSTWHPIASLLLCHFIFFFFFTYLRIIYN